MATLSSLPPSPWPNSNPNSDFTPQNDDLHSPIPNPNPSSDQHPNDDVDDDLAHAIDNLSIQNRNPNSDSVSQPPSLLHVTSNQDYGCFSSGTDRGFRIYNCDPFREIFRRDFDAGGGIGIVEMLFRCKVMIWDDHQSRCVGELTFRSEVRGVRLRRDSIVVVLEKKVLVYNFADLKFLHQIETFLDKSYKVDERQKANTY